MVQAFSSMDMGDTAARHTDDGSGGDKAMQSSINEVSRAKLNGTHPSRADAQAFQSFINANPRAPEFLSLFIDEHLKKGTKAVR